LFQQYRPEAANWRFAALLQILRRVVQSALPIFGILLSVPGRRRSKSLHIRAQREGHHEKRSKSMRQLRMRCHGRRNFELLRSLSLAYCFRVMVGDVVESTAPCLFAGSELPDDGRLDAGPATKAKLSTFVLPEC